MKVIEIIKTNQLNEGFWSKGTSLILGKPLNYVLSVIGKGSAGRGMKELVSHVDNAGKLNMTSIKASYGQAFADDLAKNTKLVNKIEKSAASAAKSAQWSKNIEEVKAFMSSIKTSGKVILRGLEGLSRLALGYTIIEPWRDYLAVMNDVEEKVDSGEYTFDDLAQIRKKELGILIGRLTTAFLGFKAAKFPGWAIKGILPNSLAPLVDKLTTVGQAYLLNWLNSPANANAIATLMVQPIAGGISAADVAGNLYSKAESALTDAIQNQESGTAAQSLQVEPTSSTSATTTPITPVSPTQPEELTSPETPAAPTGSARDKSKWVPYGPGKIMDPETGEITLL